MKKLIVTKSGVAEEPLTTAEIEQRSLDSEINTISNSFLKDAEIKAKLREIDIRSLRPFFDGETEIFDDLRVEAKNLRSQLKNKKIKAIDN